MSGKHSGVQQCIKAIAPQGIYIHCYVHTLNLVLVDVVKSIRNANEFFVLLDLVYVFMSTSKAHAIFIETTCTSRSRRKRPPRCFHSP